MCDYSLHGVENRLAVRGETLVVFPFPTGSKGLTSPKYLEVTKPGKGFFAFLATMFSEPRAVCAVCIPDGAQLALSAIPLPLQREHGLSENEVVTFRQTTADEATHRDAVAFGNGVILSLQKLESGQTVRVLSLSSENAKNAKNAIEDAMERIEVLNWR